MREGSFMKNLRVLMPIKYIYQHNLTLDYVLKTESFLFNKAKICSLNVDLAEFVDEWSAMKNLIKFKNGQIYMEYNIDKYLPCLRKDKVCNLSNIQEENFREVIGLHCIDVEMFNYLNQSLWKEWLKEYTNKLISYERKSMIGIEISFKTEMLREIYFIKDESDFFSELVYDVELFITYNRLGHIRFNDGYKCTSKEISFGVNMEIF